MSLWTWWPIFFVIIKGIVLFKTYFKSLVLRFEIFRDKTFSLIPIFTTLILLLLFQIIKIHQCCGFTFTNFLCFLMATNALTTTFFFFQLGFTPCKAEQPLRGMELKEKKHKKILQDTFLYLFRKNLQLKDVC